MPLASGGWAIILEKTPEHLGRSLSVTVTVFVIYCSCCPDRSSQFLFLFLATAMVVGRTIDRREPVSLFKSVYTPELFTYTYTRYLHLRSLHALCRVRMGEESRFSVELLLEIRGKVSYPKIGITTRSRKTTVSINIGKFEKKLPDKT